MRKIVIACVLASAAYAAPALAKEGSLYAGVDIGTMLVEDSNVKATSTGTSINQLIRQKKKVNFDIDAVIGYDFGAFRLEGEIGHRTSKVLNAFRTPFPASPAVPLGIPGGRASNTSFMANLLVDVGADDGLQGFFGGGIGYASTRYRTVLTPGLSDSDKGFAAQGLLGLRYPLTEKIDLTAKYRFLIQPKIDLVNASNVPGRTRWHSHSALVGLSFNFK